MTIDPELTKRAADLLRNPANVALLGAAAPLLGKIAVEYRPAPPPKEAKPKPPPRACGKPAESGEVSAPPPGPPPMPSPWNKAAVAKRANTHAKFEDGSPIAVVITVDGACWERLNERGRTHSLLLALRSIRHKESATGGDVVKIEKPPICCWPDMAAEATDLIAQLGPDGAVGAALTGALASSDFMENLEEAIAKVRRRLDAGQGLNPLRGRLNALSRALADISDEVWGPDENACEDEDSGEEEIEDDGPSDNGPSADIERH